MRHVKFWPYGESVPDLSFHVCIPKITWQDSTEQTDISTIDGHLAQTRSQNKHIVVIQEEIIKYML